VARRQKAPRRQISVRGLEHSAPDGIREEDLPADALVRARKARADGLDAHSIEYDLVLQGVLQEDAQRVADFVDFESACAAAWQYQRRVGYVEIVLGLVLIAVFLFLTFSVVGVGAMLFADGCRRLLLRTPRGFRSRLTR
jgi:hypothetical protein